MCEGRIVCTEIVLTKASGLLACLVCYYNRTDSPSGKLRQEQAQINFHMVSSQIKELVHLQVSQKVYISPKHVKQDPNQQIGCMFIFHKKLITHATR